MDPIKSYLVSNENVLIQLKPPVLPCASITYPLLIPSVFTVHNLEKNEDLGCHNFCENILEVKTFDLLYSRQTFCMFTTTQFPHRKASLWRGWAVSFSPCKCS